MNETDSDDWASIDGLDLLTLIDRMPREDDLMAAMGDDVAALARLAGHPDARVRAAVAGNPNSPAYVLDRLAGDPSEGVLISLVRNKAVTARVVDTVVDRALRTGGEVSRFATSSPRLTPRAARALLDAGFAGELAANPATPPDLLEEIYGRCGSWTRNHVVCNPSCPHDLRVRASTEDPSRYVREAAASRLASGDDPRIFATVDDLTPGRAVLIGADIGSCFPRPFLLDISAVGEVETRAVTLVDGREPHEYQVVTLTGIRRRPNGEPSRRYPDPVTYQVLVEDIRIPG